MSVSFPASSGVPEQFFAFASSGARDSFMRALQAKTAALAAPGASVSVPVTAEAKNAVDGEALAKVNLPPQCSRARGVQRCCAQCQHGSPQTLYRSSHSLQSHSLPTSAGTAAASATAPPAGQAQPSDADASDAISEDARFEAAYAEVLKSSGRPFSFTQLCLVGEGRAGKTSLANSLCGRAFVQTDSTIGVGLEQMQVTHVDLQVAAAGRWTVLQQSDGGAGKFSDDQLAWAMARELEGKQGGDSSSGSIADIIRVSESRSSFDFADDALASSSPSRPAHQAPVTPAPSSISSLPSSSSAAATA